MKAQDFETKKKFLVSFLRAFPRSPSEATRSRERTRLPAFNKEKLPMKKLSVVVAGTGQIRDVEIQPGTSAGDILQQLTLTDYLLSKGPNEPFFAAAESVYDKVKDGEKIFASTKAEVGIAVCA
jgi:hypothetical protein